MKRYERYKLSRVEWVEQIPLHWEVKRLKYCFTLITEKSDLNLPKVGLENIGSNTGRFIETSSIFEGEGIDFEANDILFGKLRPYLAKVYLSEFDGKAIGDFYILRCNKNINPKFGQKLLISKNFINIVNDSTHGSKMPRVSWDFMGNLHIPIPEQYEQEIIANYLDKKTVELEELIADKLNLISLLEQKKELTISNAVTKGLNPNVPTKDSKVKWIGEIPKHWEVKKIKYIFTSFDYKRVPLSADERGKMSQRIYDYYGASGIIDKVESYIFDGDYLLIGEDGANLLDRNSDLVFKASGKFWVNNHAHILQPIKNDIDFYIYYLENLDFTMWISGSAQPKLTADALNNIHVAVPPIIEQQQIVKFLDKKIAETNEAVQIIKDEIELLKEYKETLIYEVITGKIDVRAEL